MKLLKTILVAVDFDDTLDTILAVASDLAKKLGSEVVLTHIVEAADESGEVPEAVGNSITARLGEMQKQLTANGVSVPQVFCLSGKAAVEIVEAAERIGANLILLGAHGVAKDPLFPLGTTTEKVIRWSAKPVLAVPRKPPLAFANIVCPVDFSDVSARGLTTAIHVARASGGKLQILTVVAPPSGFPTIHPPWGEKASSAQQERTNKCQRELEEFLGRFDLQDVTWEKHVLNGDPAHEIVNWARATTADLIVMGSVGRTGLPFMLMGSTAVKVLRQLPCALLIEKRVQVLVPDIANKIADINAAFEEGQALLGQGYCQEAIVRFEQCLSIDSRCADAIEAKAEALDRLGRREQADECRKLAESIRRELAEQRVTASVRAQHPFFHRRGPYQ
jgi:nucleotide-binding universal stress UspA family protein